MPRTIILMPREERLVMAVQRLLSNVMNDDAMTLERVTLDVQAMLQEFFAEVEDAPQTRQ